MSAARSAKRRFSYQALSYSQRSPHASPRFLVFHAAASDIMEWADVDRLQPNNPTGPQRPLRGIKVSKVARFLEKDSRNTIPTAIVVALDSDSVTFRGEAGP